MSGLLLEKHPRKPVVYGPLRAVSGVFPIPQYPVGKKVCQEQIAMIDSMEKVIPPDSVCGRLMPPVRRFYQNQIDKCYTPATIPPVMLPLQALSLPGNICFVTFPFETFSLTTLNAAKTAGMIGYPSDRVFTIGYCNGSFGYLPTPSALPYGGYEIESTPIICEQESRWSGRAEGAARQYLIETLARMQ